MEAARNPFPVSSTAAHYRRIKSESQGYFEGAPGGAYRNRFSGPWMTPGTPITRDHKKRRNAPVTVIDPRGLTPKNCLSIKNSSASPELAGGPSAAEESDPAYPQPAV